MIKILKISQNKEDQENFVFVKISAKFLSCFVDLLIC